MIETQRQSSDKITWYIHLYREKAKVNQYLVGSWLRKNHKQLIYIMWSSEIQFIYSKMRLTRVPWAFNYFFRKRERERTQWQSKYCGL